MKHKKLLTDEDWREWQANVFASALLMPSWAVRYEFEKRVGSKSVLARGGEGARRAALSLTDELVVEAGVYEETLAQKFRVSPQAMSIRLLGLDLVKEA